MSDQFEFKYPFKKEHVLTDERIAMSQKVQALIATWRELAELDPMPSKESLHNLAKFLLSHTLSIVLSVKWMKYKNENHSRLELVMKDCMKKYAAYPEFQIVATKLLSLIKGPWSKPEIMHMLSAKSITPTKKDYDFFVYEESAYIISMRLKKLCEDKCGDMALNLTRCYLKCWDWAVDTNLNMCISENQKKFVYDIYLSLLFQHDGFTEMSSFLKTMEIGQGIEMVRRFAAKSPSKLWENHINVAKFSGTIFLTRCARLPFEEASHYLSELLEVWSSVFSPEQDAEEVIESLRRIIKNAGTPAHMYLFMDHVSSRFGVTMRPYSVEVCIQAINSDLNCLERAKTESSSETDATHLEAISVRAADGFMRLADQFAENLDVARECVLTAFSIMPTPRIFTKIEEMARASGYEVLDTGQWKCKTHPPACASEEVLIHCDQCGEYKSDLKLNEALKQTNAGLIEAFKVNNMGLPSELCDDLVVIIFCARYQMLSWSQRWLDLQRLCVMYLNDPVGTKNLITELKFLEIDYTPFMIKREMEEYVSGDEQIEPELEYPYADDEEVEVEGDELVEDEDECEQQHFEYFNGYVIDRKRGKGKRARVLSDSSESDTAGEVTFMAKRLSDCTDQKQERINENHNHSDPNVLKALKSYRRKRLENEDDGKASSSDANDGTSADAEYEFDTYTAYKSSFLHNSSVETGLVAPSTSASPATPLLITSSALTPLVLTPVTLHHSYAAPASAIKIAPSHKVHVNVHKNQSHIVNSSSLTVSTNSDIPIEPKYQPAPKVVKRRKCYDPPEKKFQQEFGNFQHDAENYEIDRTRPVATAPDSGDGGVQIQSDNSDSNDRIDSNNSSVTNNAAIETQVALPEVLPAPQLHGEQNLQDQVKDIDIDTNAETEQPIALNETEVLHEAAVSVSENEPEAGKSSQNLLEFYKKEYNIKECRIVLVRCEERKENVLVNERKPKKKRKYNKYVPLKVDRGALRRKTQSLRLLIKSSENVVKEFNYNKYPLRQKGVNGNNANNNNRRILRTNNNLEAQQIEALKKRMLIGPDMNPVVVLKRLEESCMRSLLSRVPGFYDTQLFRPADTDRVVNVVQVAGGRSTSSVQAPNTQTSTQVSPHIQRIGQPRIEKSDTNTHNSEAHNSVVVGTTTVGTKTTTNTFTLAKPTSSTSTLINILSQHVSRPAISNNARRGGLINIISQPAIKSTTNVTNRSTVTSEATTTQLNSTTTRIIATSSEQQQQILNQLVNSNRGGVGVKAVVGTSSSEPGRIVQFICKSTDGKLIPVTSFPSNRLLKVGTATNVSNSNQQSVVLQHQPVQVQVTTNNAEDAFAKLANSGGTTGTTGSGTNGNGKKAEDATTTAISVEGLPKFQQAFGKSVYQTTNDGGTGANNASNAAASTNNTDIVDKTKQLTQTHVKTVFATAAAGSAIANTSTATITGTPIVMTTAVNMQPLQGSVIYTRQMPVGQTINLIQQNRGQVFRIATTNSDQISLVKDGAIHSKMSALLAAALQGQGKPKINTNANTESSDESEGPTTTTARVLTRPALVQNARIVKPVLQLPTNVNVIRTPQNQQGQQGGQQQSSLSNTTLEQLREFDRVFKQVKERSSTSTPADTSATSSETESSPQRVNVTYLNQSQKISCTTPVVVVSSYSMTQAASPALSVASQGSSSPSVTPAPPLTPTPTLTLTSTPVLPKVTPTKSTTSTVTISTGSTSTGKSGAASGGKTVKNPQMHAAKTSPIPKPQQKPQEDEHTTQRIFDILAEYAEQLRNSPDLNNKPAPRRRSNPPTNPSQNSKRKKSSSSKKTTCGSSLSTEVDLEDHRTVGSEDSSCGVVQLSMQDDDQNPTGASASESNDSTTMITPRAQQQQQQLILTETHPQTLNQTRNLIIADSSSVGEALKMPNTAVLVPGNYIMPVSMVKGGQQIAVVSGGSKILATVPARSGPNMLLFQSFLNQNRKPGTIGAGATTVKYSTIQPITGITSHTISGVSAQPPVILPPPGQAITLGQSIHQPITIKKMEDSDRAVGVGVNTEQLLLTISQAHAPTREETNEDSAVSQPDSTVCGTNAANIVKLDIDDNTAMSSSDSSSEKAYFQKETAQAPIATPVIAQNIKEEQVMTMDINPSFVKDSTPKNEERVQSVLVTAGTSNGPMLSHSPPQYKQTDCSNGNEPIKDDFLRNGGKRCDKVQSTVFCVQGKIKKSSRMDREVQQMCMQRRQAAIERELRLQKSLSEECEDLGVDEPSTSDLFPEALLFDSNNSPSFDQTSQDNLKRPQTVEKEENKLSLFSDDDFIFEPSHYDEGNTQLGYEEVVDSRILSNGQDGVVSTEDTTLLQTCTSMSDVTLSSPISPDNFRATTSPPLNKYMHKYTNKKKTDKIIKQIHDNDQDTDRDGGDGDGGDVANVAWSADVSSSEDTMESTELNNTNNLDIGDGDADADDDEDHVHNHDHDEELDLSSLNAGSFKVVRINVGNTCNVGKAECNEVHCFTDEEIELDGSLSGRGARKTIKKKCSCCNGAEENHLNLNVNANTHVSAANNSNNANNLKTNASTNNANLLNRKRSATTLPQLYDTPHKKTFPNNKKR